MKIIYSIIIFCLGLMAGKFIFERWDLHDFQIMELKEIAFTDGSIYEGTVENGKAHGKGKQTWGNGDYYEGEFENGLMHGTGKITYSDGGYYEGDFEKGMSNGRGKEVANDGSTVVGDYVDGKLEGKAELTLADGTSYQGNFKNNLYDGYGVLKGPDGMQYMGNFKQGKFEGDGNLVYANNDSYLGEFKNNQFEGYGVYQTANGDRYVGNFKEGSLEGDSEIFLTDGSVYKGNTESWMYHGEGELKIDEGEHYFGEFFYGEYSGKGRLVQTNGSEYDGEFVSGLANGNGVFKDKEGKIFEGIWVNGKLETEEQTIKIGNQNNIEYLLNRNGLLLKENIASIANGVEGKKEYFSILLAGDGTQKVFEKEVKYISQYLNPEYTLILANQKGFDANYPLANKGALRTALNGIASKMNSDEDVLFLYMTSHGSENGALSIKKTPFSLNDIYHQDIAKMLENTDIDKKVIFVSSCYSGTYIPYLKDETTTVITAASATTTSFGCSNDSDMTWFAKAFFEDLKEDTIDLKAQFDKAVKKVKQWEAEQEFEFSNPQIWIGENAPTDLPIIIQ